MLGRTKKEMIMFFDHSGEKLIKEHYTFKDIYVVLNGRQGRKSYFANTRFYPENHQTTFTPNTLQRLLAQIKEMVNTRSRTRKLQIKSIFLLSTHR